MPSSPFIVAEIGANHNGSLERARRLVEAAADAGVDGVKLQCWSPGSMAIAGEWKGKSLPKLYEDCWTPWSWFSGLFAFGSNRGIEVFASAFDKEAVDFLETRGVKRHKIASFELVDLPLIEYARTRGKPLIISTGMGTKQEITDAVITARSGMHPWPEVTLLACTSAYPADCSDAQLRRLSDMRTYWGCAVGLSDHTPGCGVAVAAVALGAQMIEKHLTLRRSDGGPDSAHSLEPEEFKQLVIECRRAYESLGEVKYGPSESEQESLKLRRSLWITQDLKVGDMLTPENLRSMRPADGLPPKHLNELLGKRVIKDVRAGTPMTMEVL